MPHAAPQSDLSYESLRAQLQQADNGSLFADYHGYRCGSAFQPIVSFAHACVVGHEALLRAHDAHGAAVPPPVLLDEALEQGGILHLDRLCRTLHIANAAQAHDGWLFLNIHPESLSATQQSRRKAFMHDLLDSNGIDPQNVVIEITEELISDEESFGTFVGQLRDMGCRLAIDDFGAGHSNFDRVWQITPDIVKLDRRFAVQCDTDANARRMLPRIVNMLHEAGALVLLEGIETRGQAMIALEADIDFAQGYYFARPAPVPLPVRQAMPAAVELWTAYEQNRHEGMRQRRQQIAPYEQAIVRAATKLAMRTEDLAGVCGDFLALPEAEFCYLLDSQGMQVGANVWSSASERQPAGCYRPVADSSGARWSRRPYFRRALEHFGQVQTTRPYLSTATGHLCVTISLAFHQGREARVLCGDIRWH